MQNTLANAARQANIVPMSSWKLPENAGRCLQAKIAPQPAPQPKNPVAYVRFEKVDYRIFKKRNRPTDTWYWMNWRNGKRDPINLESHLLEVAEKNLKLLLTARKEQKFEEMRAVLNGSADAGTPLVTIEKYLHIYENTPTGENLQASRHGAALKVKLILSTTNSAAKYIHELGPALRKYRAYYNGKVEAESDQQKKLSLKRTCNSGLRNAAMTFSEGAERALREKFTLPDFTALRKTVKELYFGGVSKSADEYRPPAEAIRDETLKSWLTLPRNEFIAVGVALAGGLRRGEIARGNKNWFVVEDGVVLLNTLTQVKNQSGVLRLACLEPFHTLLMDRIERAGWLTDADAAFIINGRFFGPDYDYSNASEFDRNISTWMRGLGWQTKKHLHALRAWAGSLVYMRYGAEAACDFCRHGDVKTTQRYYGWMRQKWRDQNAPVTVLGRPVEWAKVSAGRFA